MKKTLFTITCAMFSLGLLVSVSPAQSTRVNTKPKIKKPVVKKKVNTKKLNLAPTSPAQCARQKKNSTNRRFNAICVKGTKVGKNISCNGSRSVPNTENYRTQYCTVLQGSGHRNFVLKRSGRSTKGIDAILAADFACGCGPHVANQTCSGGQCTVDLPD